MDCTKAELAASRVLHEFGIYHPGTLDLRDLAMTLGVLVTELPLAGAEARLVRKNGKGIIRVNNAITNRGRLRFAIGHEIGHWLQHGETSQLQVCIEEDLSIYLGSRLEVEANTFSAHLLMPTRYILDNYREAPSFEVVRTLASDLDVSFTAAALRIVETTDDSCIVAFIDTSKGHVSWWKRSKRCSFWLERHQQVDELSAVYGLLSGRADAFEAEQCATSAWFPQSVHKDSIVVEEGLAIPRYSTAVVLLTICE